MPQLALSDDKYQAIVKDIGKMSQDKIAQKHGVSQGTVSKINRGIITSEQADPANKRILQLEAQNIALHDEIRRCKVAYKTAQRENSVFEAMVDELKQVIKPVSPLPKIIKVKSKDKIIRESLVAYLSDEHADAEVFSHQVGGLERYNFPIALRRAEVYVDSIIKFSQRTLTNYKFSTLYIFAIGDHSSGEIHKSVDHSYYRNQFRNCLAVGQMHSLMLRDLAPFFDDIKILYLPGNHGRRSEKKDYHGAWNSWDYLIAEVAKLHCVDLKNVEFLIPDSFSAVIEIEGFNFGLSHGDDVRSWNSIPWYGIERKTRRLIALSTVEQKIINYFGFGHFHQPANHDVLRGEVMINGSWVATDPYIYEKLSGFTEPSQWLHGVHRDYGISWRLKIKLRSAKEHLGPNRFVVNLAKEM